MSRSAQIMAAAVLRQLGEPFPREEIDLDAVRAIATAATEADAIRDELVAALEKIASETAATWVSDVARAALARAKEQA